MQLLQHNKKIKRQKVDDHRNAGDQKRDLRRLLSRVLTPAEVDLIVRVLDGKKVRGRRGIAQTLIERNWLLRCPTDNLLHPTDELRMLLDDLGVQP